jgi:hypothetical protein
LEAVSRTFALVRRSKFPFSLLGDTEFIASSNSILAEGDLAPTRPIFEKMQNERVSLEYTSRTSRIPLF